MVILDIPPVLQGLRIGQGYDIHRLADNLPLWLGGVLVSTSSRGAVAHSDGDVLLHALIDAILSVGGYGDIGDIFPPTDEQWRNAASLDLLTSVKALVSPVTWLQVDMTVCLERPKLGDYKAHICQQVADAMVLPVNRVSLKAKTAEQLGALGQGEAVAASVIVLAYSGTL